MPRPLRSYRLSPDLIAANAGGSVVCIDVGAAGRVFRLHASRPDSYETIRSDVFDWSGDAVEAQALPSGTPSVAIVEIRGPIEQRGGYHQECGGWSDGHDAIADRLCAALEDPDVGAVYLVVDSPGGAAAGLREAVTRVQLAKEASGKPIIAYAQEMIGSAAYWWVACVADEIWTPRDGQIGSIGARAAHGSMAGALAKEGVEITYFAWPPGKVALASELPLSELGKARGDRDVKACAEAFFAAVGPARGLSHDDLMALNADCLSGAAAVAAGLADGIATYEEVLDYALTLASGAGGSMNLRTEGDEPEKKDPPDAEGDDMPETEGEEPSTACSACSMANEPNAKFCDQCGASMAAVVASASEDEEGPPSSKPAPRPGASARSAKTPMSLAALAGLRPGASTPAIITALAPLRAVFDHASKITGMAKGGEIIGGLTALAEDAKRGVQAGKDLRAAKQKADHSERWQLARKLTAAMVPGYERGKVFVDDVDDKTGKKTTALAPHIAEMKLDTFRGLVTTLTADRKAQPRDPFQPSMKGAQDASRGAGHDPSASSTQLAAKTNLDPAAMATAESFLNNILKGAQ